MDAFPFDWVHLFDAEQEVLVKQRRLPHWAQAGAICFITFRTCDSMPKQVLDRWMDDRSAWLLDREIDPEKSGWRNDLKQLDACTASTFQDEFWNRWHDALDEGRGACVLRDKTLSEIVSGSLLHFDEERYLMLDFIVMPNHAHLLCSFADEEAMLKQCEAWKRFTGRQINLALNREGRFWQSDAFDHLVRSEEQYVYLKKYIAENPRKAGLPAGEFAYYSRTERS